VRAGSRVNVVDPQRHGCLGAPHFVSMPTATFRHDCGLVGRCAVSTL
jgi:hypothetical protein